MSDQSPLSLKIALADSRDGNNIRVVFPAGSSTSEGIALNVFILNESDVRVDYAAIGLLMDKHLDVALPPLKGLFTETPRPREVRGTGRGGTVIPINEYIIHWCAPTHLPIFREYRQPLFPSPLQIKATVQQANSLIAWWIVAPGMEIRTGFYMLGHRGNPNLVPQGSVGEAWLEERGELPQGALDAE